MFLVFGVLGFRVRVGLFIGLVLFCVGMCVGDGEGIGLGVCGYVISEMESVIFSGVF